jgi:hypothetical protein
MTFGEKNMKRGKFERKRKKGEEKEKRGKRNEKREVKGEKYMQTGEIKDQKVMMGFEKQCVTKKLSIEWGTGGIINKFFLLNIGP